MADDPDSAYDLLWKEYSLVFQDFDDLTLARWMAQTLGQFRGKVWRLSHPLVATYRLAAHIAHQRQTWFQRLAPSPHDYPESPCCRAPLLPLLTRSVNESGLGCMHCNDTVVPLEELPEGLQADLKAWAAEYAPVHQVAHWDDQQRREVPNYNRAFEAAAQHAETLLSRAGGEFGPRLLELYPAVIWEDQDECLEVNPEDVETKAKG